METKKQGWKIVKLREVLKPSVNQVSVMPFEKYPQIGIRLWGEGVYAREEVLGSETQYKFFYQAKAGDLTFNKIWVRNGAVGVIPSNLHNFYVSPEFPVYHPEESIVSSDWLNFLTQCRFFWDRCNEKAYGTSGKNRVKPGEFLQIEIPLPPLSEQRRIAARLQALKWKIGEVRRLREEQVKAVEILLDNVFDLAVRNLDYEKKKIANVAELKTGKTPPTSHPHYFDGNLDWYCPSDINNQIDCYLLGSSRKISKEALNDRKATWYEKGTVLLISIGGTIGKVGILQESASSNQQITGIKFNDSVLPEYGYYWLKKTKSVILEKAGQATLPIINQKKIGDIEIVVPPLTDQRNIVVEIQSIQSKLDALKAAQSGQLSELGGVFPEVLEEVFQA